MFESDSTSERNFKRFIGISIVGHLVLILALNIDSLWISEDELIIKNAIKVDVVGLPEKKKKRLPPKKVAKKPKPVEKPKDKPPEPKKKKPEPKPKKDLKKAQQSAMAKLKKLAEQEKKRKQQEALEKLKNTPEPEEAPEPVVEDTPLAGNVITSGTNLKGLDKIQMDRYFGHDRWQLAICTLSRCHAGRLA